MVFRHPRGARGMSEATRTVEVEQALGSIPSQGLEDFTALADRKKFTKSQQIGESGHALIHRRVAAMGHVWHQRAVDVGIDGEIELFDPATSEATSASVLVQSKAHDNAIPGENDDQISYPLKQKDLEYWLKANLPVILVVSRPSTDEAWWVDIQAYFSDPARRARARVEIDKGAMVFTGDVTEQFFAIADPRGRAYAPGAEERTETLLSNLLSVAQPETYLSSRARVRRAGDVYRAQRDTGLELRHDFVLHGGRLLTWRPVEGTALAGVVEGESSEHPIGELLDKGQTASGAWSGCSTEDAGGPEGRVQLARPAAPALLPRHGRPVAQENKHQRHQLANGVQGLPEAQ